MDTYSGHLSSDLFEAPARIRNLTGRPRRLQEGGGCLAGRVAGHQGDFEPGRRQVNSQGGGDIEEPPTPVAMLDWTLTCRHVVPGRWGLMCFVWSLEVMYTPCIQEYMIIQIHMWFAFWGEVSIPLCPPTTHLTPQDFR